MSQGKGLFERVVKGFAWEGGARVIIQILSWGTTFAVARILSPDDYGIVAISGVFVGILAVITEFGLTSGLINKKETTREEEDGIYWLSLGAGFLSYAVVYVTAPTIAAVYQIEELTDIMRVAGLGLIIKSMNVVPIALAMRQLDFRYKAIVDMVSNLVAIVVVLVMAFNGYGAWSLVWSFLTLQLVSVVAYLPLLKRFPNPVFRWRAVRGVAGFGGKVMTSRVLEFGTHEADVFIIGLILGPTAVGYYTLAMRLAVIPLDKIGSVFNRIAFPTFSRIKEDRDRCRRVFIELHRYLLMVAYPLIVMMMVAAEELVAILLGPKWSGAAPILQVLCLVNLVRVSGMLFPHALSGIGRPDLVLRYYLLSVAVLPVTFYVGASMYGVMGVTYAWLVGYPILYVLVFRYVATQLLFRTSEVLRSAVPAIVAGTIMAISLSASLQISHDSDEYLIVSGAIVVSVVGYVLTLMFMYPRGVGEIRKGLDMLRGRGEVAVK